MLYWLFFGIGMLLFVIASIILFKNKYISTEDKAKLTVENGKNFLMRIIYSIINVFA